MSAPAGDAAADLPYLPPPLSDEDEDAASLPEPLLEPEAEGLEHEPELDERPALN